MPSEVPRVQSETDFTPADKQKAEKERVYDSISGNTNTNMEKGWGDSSASSAQPNTQFLKMKSQINESSRMGKQHTMFASYIAPA